MEPKPQIVFVHGGDSFATNEELYAVLRMWTFDPYAPERNRGREWVGSATAETHDFLSIRMPNKQNADYIAWSIWFDKVVPYLREGVVLIGHSMGGGFYLRYLTENKLPITVAQLHLVAPVVDMSKVGGFKINLETWSVFQSNIDAVHLWHSTDDTVVPIDQSERFKAKVPSAHLHTFTDRGHFLTDTFPELLAEIQK